MLDALFTLPLLSFLAVPTLSSWSTSLNILFFYLTWSTLVLSYKPLQVELFATLAVRLLCFLVPAAIFLGFDSSLPSVAVGIKQRGQAANPRRIDSRRLPRVVGVAVFNLVLEFALQAVVELLSTLFLGKSALRVTTRLPLPFSILKHLIYGLSLRGVLQYYLHRYVLHSQNSNSLPTKWHASWQHSLGLPFSLMALYDHPVANLIHNWIPLYLPAYLFRMHVLTFQLLVAITSLENLFVYSGYSVLPSTIMLNGMARRLEIHFASRGKGNFGALGVLDWVYGTSEGPDVMKDFEAEMDKHNVQEKAGRAVDGAGGMLEDAGDRLKGNAKSKNNKKK